MACFEHGCIIIVRGARQNAEAKQTRIEVAASREAGRQEREAKAVATTTATIVATSAATIAD